MIAVLSLLVFLWTVVDVTRWAVWSIKTREFQNYFHPNPNSARSIRHRKMKAAKK